jgi:hypothetical protein
MGYAQNAVPSAQPKTRKRERGIIDHSGKNAVMRDSPYFAAGNEKDAYS